jgi:hypothetical protein
MSREVCAQAVINLPLDKTWEKLRDISQAHNYVPGIVKTEIVSEQNEGIGASRYVYRSAKSYIQETVEEWDEGRGFLIRLHKGDKPAPPFRNAWFRYQLTEQGPEQTLFSASLTFELPWGKLGAWLENKMAGVVQNIVSDVALAMKLYYETGEPVTAAALRASKSERSQKR